MVGDSSTIEAQTPTLERASAARARADSRSRLQQRRGELLSDLAARLLAGQDLDREVMPALYRGLAAETIVDATLGFIVTDMDGPMQLGFMEGFEPEMIQRCLTLDFGQAICGTVAATRQPMHVTGIQQSFDPIADLVRSAGINAYACEPLIVGEQLLGTLSFASRTRRSFDPDDLSFFRTVARHVALARDRVRRARLRESESAG